MIPEVLSKAGTSAGMWVYAGGKSAGYPFPIRALTSVSRKERAQVLQRPELGAEDGDKTSLPGAMRPDRLSEFATDDPSDPIS